MATAYPLRSTSPRFIGLITRLPSTLLLIASVWHYRPVTDESLVHHTSGTERVECASARHPKDLYT